eukprot:jgi/Psemu1/15134/gm1.15134_g
MNESSGTISSLTTTTRSRISCEAIAIQPLLTHEADDDGKDVDKADADSTSSTMMLSHNVTQYKGATRDDDDDNNAVDANNNNKNKNDKLHVGMQDGYYYKDGTQPPQDYSPSDNNKSKLGEPSWHDIDNPGAWDRFCYQSKLEKGSGGREYKGWTFHYQNWVPEEDTPTFSHRYTSSRDLFPQERKGKLDTAKLRKHGLQLGRVLNSDALFFYQLLLPFHADEEDDKQENEMRQKPFYSEVLRWSNNYANQSNTGKGHYVRRIKLSELVHFDGIVYLHGALEGKKGSICYRWTKVVGALYSPKYNRLLCKDDMRKFNYAYKFDYIYETLVHNICYFSKKGCSDLCMDDGRIKLGILNLVDQWGGQTVILSDVDKVRPPGYLHRHRHYKKQPLRSTKGCSEVQGLGFGMIGTVAQNRLPKTVEDKYFHKENVSSASAKRCSRIARLCNPVTMVKEVHARAEAGRFTKGKWGIEMNHLQELYLQMYGKLDQVHSAISRSNIGCKSWKFYHVPINYAKALTVLTAFDMYQELTDGTHGVSWFLPKRQQLDFRQFKQKLAEQMLAYNPSDNGYPVNVLLREVTQS